MRIIQLLKNIGVIKITGGAAIFPDGLRLHWWRLAPFVCKFLESKGDHDRHPHCPLQGHFQRVFWSKIRGDARCSRKADPKLFSHHFRRSRAAHGGTGLKKLTVGGFCGRDFGNDGSQYACRDWGTVFWFHRKRLVSVAVQRACGQRGGIWAGFGLADLLGSQANDPFRMENGKVVTATNHNGGINGGISNGMPIQIRTVIKPTPSIYQEQETIDYTAKENTVLTIHGRHDPAIIHRARVVVDSVVAIGLVDLFAERYGYLWMAE